MITININKQELIKTFLFPDNQPHVKMNKSLLQEGQDVQVYCSITDSESLMYLLECSNALSNLFCKKKVLVIPYLMGARFDRVMELGDSFDLKVVADLINMCEFEKVILFDPHSDVATALIKNSVSLNNKTLIERYYQRDAILICPDAGASKKVGKYLEWNANIRDVVYCAKNRDLSTGEISLKVLSPEKCVGNNCVIIDDLCDGGGTFLAIASQIQPKHLTLIVSHAIFSKGIEIFRGKIDEIITTDSYKHHEHDLVETIKIEPSLLNY